MICRLLIIVISMLTVVPVNGAASTVLFLGDSLTAGYGVSRESAFPAVVSRLLKEEGIQDVKIINAGISGSTTASSLSRIKWHSRVNPDVLFLALGANDGLRGLSVDQMEKNLGASIVFAKEQDMMVILAGMKVPPNYGQSYADAFRQVYRTLSDRYGIVLIPFLLEGVGGVAELNQADGIHPNEAGHKIIARHVYPYIRDSLSQNGQVR